MLGRMVPDHKSHSVKVEKELVHVSHVLRRKKRTDVSRRLRVGAVGAVRRIGGLALEEDGESIALGVVVALGST